MYDETRTEIYREHGGPTGDGLLTVILVIVIGASAAGLIHWLAVAAPAAYAAKSPLNFVLAIVVTFLAAGLFYYFREVKKLWFVYPPIEIGISCGLAMVAVGQKQPLVSVIALLAAVRVAVDGINRFLKFREDTRLARVDERKNSNETAA